MREAARMRPSIPPLLFSLFTFLLALTSTAAVQAQPFVSKAADAGLSRAFFGHGVAVADYDNDGDIDIYMVTKTPTTAGLPGTANLLYRNRGDGFFDEVAESAGVQGIQDTTRIFNDRITVNYGAIWGDYDNDGNVDLYLTNKGRDQLFQNRGDGTFEDVTHNAGLGILVRESSSAAWFDLDHDGDLDLYVGSYGKYGAISSSDNVLYRNNGDGTFIDITSQAGVGDPGWAYSTLVFDFNYDGEPDIYCVNDFGPNVFFLNTGDGTFREATADFGLENDGHGMGVTVGDYDNDGLFDIFLTNITTTVGSADEEEWNPLFRQVRPEYFEDISRSIGVAFSDWGWGCELFDFDLDGDLDLFVVNGIHGGGARNRLFKNDGTGKFSDMSAESGADSEVEARGLAVADFNNDGALDMVVANWRAPAHFYLNQAASGNYLKINLVGTTSNRDARGALLTLQANGRQLVRSNDGIEFLGQSKAPVHFGLGDAPHVQSLRVVWPSGLRQEFPDIAANQTITVTEGQALITDIADDLQPLPQGFGLLPSYPNPLRAATRVFIRLERPAEIALRVYDLLGRQIATVTRGKTAAGQHAFVWNATDDTGRNVPAGVYFLRYEAGGKSQMQKLYVLR